MSFFQHLSNSFYLTKLRHSSFRPQTELIQTLGSFYICNLGSIDEHQSSISEDLSSGMSLRQDLAVAKCMSEYIERLAQRMGEKRNDPLCMKFGTDGFAAFPKFYPSSLKRVRASSLLESIERYSWHSFWHQKVAYESSHDSHLLEQYNLAHLDLREIINIYPSIEGHIKLCICLGGISSSGLVVGGGCGYTYEEARERAFCEALRHYIAISNVRKGFPLSNSSYCKRLAFLAEEGFDLYRDRLKISGRGSVSLPELEVDSLIHHPFERFYHVYRTQFQGQKAFISSQVDVGYL